MCVAAYMLHTYLSAVFYLCYDYNSAPCSEAPACQSVTPRPSDELSDALVRPQTCLLPCRSRDTPHLIPSAPRGRRMRVAQWEPTAERGASVCRRCRQAGRQSGSGGLALHRPGATLRGQEGSARVLQETWIFLALRGPRRRAEPVPVGGQRRSGLYRAFDASALSVCNGYTTRKKLLVSKPVWHNVDCFKGVAIFGGKGHGLVNILTTDSNAYGYSRNNVIKLFSATDN